MAQSNSVTLSRMTVASAADTLRDYRDELEDAGTEGEYTQEIRDVVASLDAALEAGSHDEGG
ncbi:MULTISPECIES: hypothetical protein [Haloarcula]|uniref:hypothetical protein n=1 Tax=Haloarcula TaxID=2237 RepID=UPI0023E7C248|nr:hypothetical protein [Halomicroarcula sp. SHR3]